MRLSFPSRKVNLVRKLKIENADDEKGKGAPPPTLVLLAAAAVCLTRLSSFSFQDITAPTRLQRDVAKMEKIECSLCMGLFAPEDIRLSKRGKNLCGECTKALYNRQGVEPVSCALCKTSLYPHEIHTLKNLNFCSDCLERVQARQKERGGGESAANSPQTTSTSTTTTTTVSTNSTPTRFLSSCLFCVRTHSLDPPPKKRLPPSQRNLELHPPCRETSLWPLLLLSFPLMIPSLTRMTKWIVFWRLWQVITHRPNLQSEVSQRERNRTPLLYVLLFLLFPFLLVFMLSQIGCLQTFYEAA